MTVYTFDPVTDPRWPRLLQRHPEASIFHSREWLEAIRRTYGYEPVGYTTSSGDELTNGLVLCRVRSWLTGKRLVSLPFSDHCQPLASDQDLSGILQHLRSGRKKEGYKYIELRPAASAQSAEPAAGFVESERFRFHVIDLRSQAREIYGRFHDSCIRRKIKRADREALAYESGRSEELLQKFRALHLLTRRRHKLPPQPEAWFRNILECLGEMVTIHIASKESTPVASIVTASFKKSLVYKYGVSDGRFNNLGATPFLFWKVIQDAKMQGIEEFDLGRSDFEDEGLTAFKEHLGGTPSELRYYRHSAMQRAKSSLASPGSVSSWAREVLVRLPDPVLVGVGHIMYRHIG